MRNKMRSGQIMVITSRRPTITAPRSLANGFRVLRDSAAAAARSINNAKEEIFINSAAASHDRIKDQLERGSTGNQSLREDQDGDVWEPQIFPTL